MATYSSSKSTNVAKRALRTVEDDVTCGVFLECYKKLKQLQCWHAFCEVCLPVCPEKCHASCEGIKAITRRKEVVFSVAVLDEKEEAYLRHVESLKCELVSSDCSRRVRGIAKTINQNIYNISYQPQVTGKYQLHI